MCARLACLTLFQSLCQLIQQKTAIILFCIAAPLTVLLVHRTTATDFHLLGIDSADLAGLHATPSQAVIQQVHDASHAVQQSS